MFVRMKIGRYAGEIREMQFADGRDLVAAGHAERIDFSGPVQYPPPAPAIAESKLRDADVSSAPPVRTETRRTEQSRRTKGKR